MNDSTKLGFKKDMSDEDKLALSQAMLDSSASDIETLPDFVRPPKGSFFLDSVQSCTAGLNQAGTDVQIKIVFIIGETIELAAFPATPVDELPAGACPIPGSLVGYQWQGALGIQKFLKVFDNVIQQLNPAIQVRELIETLGSGSITGLSMITTMRADREKVEPNDLGEMVPVLYSELVSVQMM